MNKISVMIVDDSVFMRSVIRDILQESNEIEVVEEAENGEEALEKLRHIEPDVMTLDLEMPKKNGISVLTELFKSNKNVKIVIVSSYTTENSEITLDCLKMGATDFLLKPSDKDLVTLNTFTKMLVYKVKAAAQSKKVNPLLISRVIHNHIHEPLKFHSGIVVIGSSTGGPVALERLLSEFDKDFPMPILIAQHLPEQFITSLSERIRGSCNLEVFIAKDSMVVQPGSVYFVPGGHDGVLIKNGLNTVTFSIIENVDEILTPSIDKLMLSASAIYKNKTIGVILTGMGKDGLLGAKDIKTNNGIMIVQDQESSAVFGMGKEVKNANLANFVLPLDQIVKKLQDLAQHG